MDTVQTTVRLLLPYYYRLWRYVLNKLDSICTVLFGYSFYHINPSDIIERIQGQLTKKRAVERKVDSHKYNDCWLEPTLILLNCWSEDRKLSAVGRKFVVEDLENLVYQRCDIQATLIRNPEICSVPVTRPVFIIGLLRTGTTLLHNLLALNPRLKAPLLWELLNPTPPPLQQELYTDVRVSQTDKEMDFVMALQPELMAIHELKATKPDECCHLLARCFIDRHAVTTGNCMSGYSEWLSNRTEDERRKAYGFYKNQLQVLGFKQDMEHRRWVLKDAAHMWNLDALFETFPDALVINTHRDIERVMASSCPGSLTISSFYYNQKDIDLRQLGARELSQFKAMTDNLIRFRKGMKTKDRFLDLAFTQIQSDPIGTVETVYKFIGESFPDDTKRQIAEYMTNNPKYKYGKQEYTFEGYMTKSDIDEAFKEYRKQFSVYL